MRFIGIRFYDCLRHCFTVKMFTIFCVLCLSVEGVFGSRQLLKSEDYNLHQRMDKRELQVTFGVDSQEKVPAYEITTPYFSDGFGNLLGKRIPRVKTRQRRHTSKPELKFFKVQAFGRTLHLKVTEAKPKISSEAMIERIETDGRRTYKEIPEGLYYTGQVVSDPGSKVALSGHTGLTGMIRTRDDTFYIRPLPSRLAQKDDFDGQPHVIYRGPIDKLSSDYLMSDYKGKQKARTRSVRRRRERPTAGQKFLELALVADNFAISAYGEDEMTTHLLTITHIVTQLFQDSSIGLIKITPVIVGLVLKEDGLGYSSSSSLIERVGKLENFTRTGKETFPPSDDDPGHPDAVVLITKGRAGGIARLRSTCYSNIGTAVAGDAGLGSAIIVAHELAHTMGLSHDASPCNKHKNIMASTIPSGPGVMKWSKCSMEKFQEFLLSQRVNCLDDIPVNMSFVKHEPKQFYGKLAGQIINRDEQCRRIHGENFYGCPQILTSCGALGCTSNGYRCIFSSTSPADGTRCGERHWCINGDCEDDGSPIINGHWSSWSAYSNCSRPCDGGVQFKSRTCTNPAPKNGGKDCLGSDKGHWRICNVQPCPQGAKSFRDLQCEAIDPAFRAFYNSDKCLLSCSKNGFWSPQGRNVKDGTRCTNDPTDRNVCISGICRHVNCDNGIENGIRRDRCSVCNGDSSSCKLVKKFWNEPCPGFGGAKACTILEVPIGATSVYVKQDSADRNLLGVKNWEGNYIIRIPSWSRTVFTAGTKVHYYHESAIYLDKVYIPGPTTKNLTIVFIPGYPKTGVWYQLYDPSQSTTVGTEDVKWKVKAWRQCTRECAGGNQARRVECTRIDDDSPIREALCLKKSRKPEVRRPCNVHPCKPEWFQSVWSPCSKTCGRGVQKRLIICRRNITQFKYQRLPELSCNGTKPAGSTERSCNAIICHAEWMPTAWSKCSSTCAGGVKKRNIICKRRDDLGRIAVVPEIQCHYAPKPQTTMKCNAHVPCPMKYRGLGCFKDSRKEHAVPEYVKNFRSNIDWTNMTKTIDGCAEYVHKKYPKYHVFSIQFYGECWTGNRAEFTYDKYGPSNNCWEKVGKRHTNYVYSFD
ncbi:A disintegrin and metalloproteinase with thrombospondin motifs 6-like isoform X1 [Montipora foliosa]|uniref:A disintegrin and metalloproteinase with thrombospondin motifs 6-like isoform X1 n=2 Tax=Montipora foliosa TaxID=591990 RepID=UPI0035F1B21E